MKVLIGDVAWTLYDTIAPTADSSGGVDIRPCRPEYECPLVNLLNGVDLERQQRAILAHPLDAPDDSDDARITRIPNQTMQLASDPGRQGNWQSACLVLQHDKTHAVSGGWALC